MNAGDPRLRDRYAKALAEFIERPSEEGRAAAYELGRVLLLNEHSILQVSWLHHHVLGPILLRQGLSPADPSTLLERAAEFFGNCATPFEMALRGFREASAALQTTNATLERRVSERTRELQFTHDRLQAAHRDLVRTVDNLRRSNEQLEQFAFVASHDLQEPLRVIRLSLQLLAEGSREGLDEQARTYLEYAEDGVRRMKELVDAHLQYSRIEMRGEPPRLCSSQTLVDEVIADLRPALDGCGGTVSTGHLPDVMADAAQLRQVFSNLVGNAIKYRREEPPVVEIEASLEDDQVHFRVSDNGVGFDPTYCERIFVMFQRLRPDHCEGSGVGLTLAKRIVERHGGRIWASGEPGTGSVFHFTLPTSDGGFDRAGR